MYLHLHLIMNFPLRKLQRSVACLWKFLSQRLIKLQKEFSTNTQLIAVIQIQYNYNTKGFLDKQRIDCYSRAHYWLERAAKVEIIWTQKVFVQPSCEICSSAAFVFDLLRIPIFSWICNQTAVTHAIHLIQNLNLTVYKKSDNPWNWISICKVYQRNENLSLNLTLTFLGQHCQTKSR